MTRLTRRRPIHLASPARPGGRRGHGRGGCGRLVANQWCARWSALGPAGALPGVDLSQVTAKATWTCPRASCGRMRGAPPGRRPLPPRRPGETGAAPGARQRAGRPADPGAGRRTDQREAEQLLIEGDGTGQVRDVEGRLEDAGHDRRCRREATCSCDYPRGAGKGQGARGKGQGVRQGARGEAHPAPPCTCSSTHGLVHHVQQRWPATNLCKLSRSTSRRRSSVGGDAGLQASRSRSPSPTADGRPAGGWSRTRPGRPPAICRARKASVRSSSFATRSRRTLMKMALASCGRSAPRGEQAACLRRLWCADGHKVGLRQQVVQALRRHSSATSGGRSSRRGPRR